MAYPLADADVIVQHIAATVVFENEDGDQLDPAGWLPGRDGGVVLYDKYGAEIDYLPEHMLEEKRDEMRRDQGWHFIGDTVGFTAERPATLFGRRYKRGEEAYITCAIDWTEEDGAGDGGPWGWGGYTSRTLRRVAGN